MSELMSCCPISVVCYMCVYYTLRDEPKLMYTLYTLKCVYITFDFMDVLRVILH